MQPPAGTPCAYHADTPASAACGQCARAVCNSCVVFDRAGAVRCTGCAAPTSVGPGTIPWENRAELGTARAFFGTVKLVLLSPHQAFAPQTSPSGLGSSIAFAVACETVGTFCALLWQAVTTLVTTWSMGAGWRQGAGELGVLSLVGLLTGPIAALCWMFVWGGIVHVGLLMFGAGRGGFEATARLQGYATATALWGVIPFIGPAIGFVWSLVVQVVGLARAHDASAGRSAAAVLTPLFLCCAGLAGMLALMVAGLNGW